MNKKEIARADILVNGDYPYLTYVSIDKEYQRKGLGTFIYNYIEKDLKIKLKPSDIQSLEAVAFWKNRLKKK